MLPLLPSYVIFDTHVTYVTLVIHVISVTSVIHITYVTFVTYFTCNTFVSVSLRLSSLYYGLVYGKRNQEDPVKCAKNA